MRPEISFGINHGEAVHAAREEFPAAAPERADLPDISESLEHLPPELRESIGEEERRLLQRLHEKDKPTLEHSVAVAHYVDRTLPEFLDDLQREGVGPHQLEHAALLHDLGKLALPDCILKSSLDHRQFSRHFMDFLQEQPDRATALMRSKGLLSGRRQASDLPEEQLLALDHRDLVPLQFLYRGNPAAIAEVISARLNPEGTFLDALKTHERKSQEFVEQTHLPDREVVAALVGSHHNYDARSEVRYPHGSEVLKLSVTASELLHLSDVLQAMVGERKYQRPLTEPEALERISEQAAQGVFDQRIAERWLRAFRESRR